MRKINTLLGLLFILTITSCTSLGDSMGELSSQNTSVIVANSEELTVDILSPWTSVSSTSFPVTCIVSGGLAPYTSVKAYCQNVDTEKEFSVELEEVEDDDDLTVQYNGTMAVSANGNYIIRITVLDNNEDSYDFDGTLFTVSGASTSSSSSSSINSSSSSSEDSSESSSESSSAAMTAQVVTPEDASSRLTNDQVSIQAELSTDSDVISVTAYRCMEDASELASDSMSLVDGSTTTYNSIADIQIAGVWYFWTTVETFASGTIYSATNRVTFTNASNQEEEDTTPPSVSLSLPNNGSSVTVGSSVSVSVTASDSGSGLDSVKAYYQAVNSTTVNEISLSGTDNATGNFTPSAAGSYNVWATASDKAGNSTVSATNTIEATNEVIVNPTEITVHVVMPVWGSTYSNLKLWFSGNGGDGYTTTYVMTATPVDGGSYSTTLTVTSASAATSYHFQFTQSTGTKGFVVTPSTQNWQVANWKSVTTTSGHVWFYVAGATSWSGNLYTLPDTSIFTSATGK